MKTKKSSPDLFSIGHLARACGISIDTLRVWERRYGRPEPVRLPSGHRRYTSFHVRWLRRVAEALTAGHRPSKILPLEEAELTALLETAVGQPAELRESLSDLVAAVERLDRESLVQGLLTRYESQDPLRFVQETVGPLVELVGREWADGHMDVRHEHFLTEVLEDVLRKLRQDLPADDIQRTICLTTLPGETHGLGLHMTALIAAAERVKPVILGTELPIEQIVHSANESESAAVGLSVSSFTGGADTDRAVSELRQSLPAEVALLVGGRGARGARKSPSGVTILADFSAFQAWLRTTAHPD